MFCKYCGNELNDMAVICPKCGCPTKTGTPDIAVTASKKSESVKFTTKGRISRSVFWKYTGISLLLILLVTFMISFAGFDSTAAQSPSGLQIGLRILGIIIAVFSFLLNLCGYIRRLQDLGISQWFLLFLFIPFLNGIAALAFLVICGFFKGEDKPNKYGTESNVI